MGIIHTPAKKEIQVSNKLRSEVKRRIKENNLNDEEVAMKLDLLPSGVESLFSKEQWPIDTAFRVAAAFDVPMSIAVRKEEKNVDHEKCKKCSSSDGTVNYATWHYCSNPKDSREFTVIRHSSEFGDRFTPSTQPYWCPHR